MRPATSAARRSAGPLSWPRIPSTNPDFVPSKTETITDSATLGWLSHADPGARFRPHRRHVHWLGGGPLVWLPSRFHGAAMGSTVQAWRCLTVQVSLPVFRLDTTTQPDGYPSLVEFDVARERKSSS
jgi:hypothetical protein